jgi:hypothetical protein
MITYQYQILRFLPDRVNGEFINLGVVVYNPSENELIGKFNQKSHRISSMFPSANTRYIVRITKFFQQEIKAISERLKSELYFEQLESLESFTKRILPKDDSALFFTEVKKGYDVNGSAALSDLYKKYVLQNESDELKESTSDKEVWSKYYKEYFDNLGISSHLHSHTVVTNNDELEFEKAWKNGKWNCFESVSFDLTRPDAIKNKVYKWIGKIDELNTAKEPLNLYLLSVFPESNTELTKFIMDKLGKIRGEKTDVNLITKENVHKYGRKIKEDIERHYNNS